MKTLRQAAQAVIDRWDSPLWKHAPATATYIADLRTALAAPEQEPVAYKYDFLCDGDWIESWYASDLCGYDQSELRNVSPLYAAPVDPYDQQSLEPCLNCEREGVKVLQAKCDAFLSFLQAAEVVVDELTKERDALLGSLPAPAAMVRVMSSPTEPVRPRLVPEWDPSRQSGKRKAQGKSETYGRKAK